MPDPHDYMYTKLVTTCTRVCMYTGAPLGTTTVVPTQVAGYAPTVGSGLESRAARPLQFSHAPPDTHVCTSTAM